MPRVKRGTQHTKRRKKLLAKTKGFKFKRNTKIRLAKTAAVKAGAHAYVDRRKKKRTNRGLQQIRISAFVKDLGMSYSQFMGALKANNIILDRKVLSELAAREPKVLAKVLESVKK